MDLSSRQPSGAGLVVFMSMRALENACIDGQLKPHIESGLVLLELLRETFFGAYANCASP